MESQDKKDEAAKDEATQTTPPANIPINPPAALPPKPTEEEEIAKDMNKAERVMARWARVTAVGTLVSAAAICFQWYEMHTGGKDTTHIAEAAKNQADAAQQFANTADDINGNIDDAVEKLDRQATATENARKSSEAASSKALNAAIDSSRLDQRAWIGTFEVTMPDPSVEKGIPVAYTFINSGKTPARSVQFASNYHYSAVPVLGPTANEIAAMRFRPVQSVAPQGKLYEGIGYLTATGDTSTASDLQGLADIRSKFQDIMDNKLTLYYFGTVKYFDVFGNERSTNFCVYIADPKIKLMAFCQNFNDIN